ncbi:MAG: transposase [Planctomycetaceae bacterium]|jgi:hypothetical protein|nr:transposase [Planctomycetaceae bacterium]
MMYNDPLAYFITFTVRGSWLHGDERGSYKKGGEFIPPAPNWVRMETDKLKVPPFLLSMIQRQVVAKAIEETCQFRNWQLLEQNVRTNHVHIVVTVPKVPPSLPVGAAVTALKIKTKARSGSDGIIISGSGGIIKPEKVMSALKANATRCLREAGLFPADQKLWTEHGSTIYLFTEKALDAARRYVRDGQ